MHITQKIVVSLLSLLAFTAMYAQDDNTKVGNATYYATDGTVAAPPAVRLTHKDSLTTTLPFLGFTCNKVPKGRVRCAQVSESLW